MKEADLFDLFPSGTYDKYMNMDVEKSMHNVVTYCYTEEYLSAD